MRKFMSELSVIGLLCGVAFLLHDVGLTLIALCVPVGASALSVPISVLS